MHSRSDANWIELLQFDIDMASPHRALFEEARNFLLAVDGIVETRKPRITTYSNSRGGICHLRTMPHGIDLGFLKGAKMNDDHGLLTGQGKAIRVLSLGKFESELVEYYIKQAVILNG